MDTTQYLTTVEAAELLRISPRSLERWRICGNGPRYFKLNQRVLYKCSDLLEWIEAGECRSTSEKRADA